MSDLIFDSVLGEGWSILIVSSLMGVIGTLGGAYFLTARTPNSWIGSPILALGLYDLAFFLRARRRFGNVTVDEEEVIVRQRGSVRTFGWHEVEACRSVRWGPMIGRCTPTIYQFTFVGTDLVIYFVPGVRDNWPLSLWDSDPECKYMLDFINKKVLAARGAI